MEEEQLQQQQQQRPQQQLQLPELRSAEAASVHSRRAELSASRCLAEGANLQYSTARCQSASSTVRIYTAPLCMDMYQPAVKTRESHNTFKLLLGKHFDKRVISNLYGVS